MSTATPGCWSNPRSECNAALAIDPGNYTFRSCAWAFMELGDTTRARDFVRLDAGSEWAAYVLPSILLREGKIAEAKEAVKQMSTAPRYHRDLLEACLQLRPASDLDGIAQDLEANEAAEADPELLYYEGAILSYCGRKQAGLDLLLSAVERNYCAYSNIVSDPLLAKLRADPAINKVLTTASQCQAGVRSSGR